MVHNKITTTVQHAPVAKKGNRSHIVESQQLLGICLEQHYIINILKTNNSILRYRLHQSYIFIRNYIYIIYIFNIRKEIETCYCRIFKQRNCYD